MKKANAARKAVILNDTSYANHHGCRLVMKHMRQALADYGVEELASSSVGGDWQHNPAFLAALQVCDIVLINGEGTLHDGREESENLLKIVEHPAAIGKRLILANALYEKNPPDWSTRYLSKFSYIGLRDSESWKTCRAEVPDVPVYLTSDLSVYGAAGRSLQAEEQRNGIAIGDSVLKPVNKQLYQLYRGNRGPNICYMPIRSSRKHVHQPYSLSALRFGLKTAIKQTLDRQHLYYKDESVFLAALASKSLYITGRFHGICLALRTGTPFLALSSNSGKVENLLQHIGLENRIVTQLDASLLQEPRPFSAEEKQKIAAFLQESQASWDSFWQQVFTH